METVIKRMLQVASNSCLDNDQKQHIENFAAMLAEKLEIQKRKTIIEYEEGLSFEYDDILHA